MTTKIFTLIIDGCILCLATGCKGLSLSAEGGAVTAVAQATPASYVVAPIDTCATTYINFPINVRSFQVSEAQRQE